MSLFKVTAYLNIYSNDPTVKEVTWEHFCERLKGPKIVNDKKSAPLFSPTNYYDNLEGFEKTREWKNRKGKLFYEWTNDKKEVRTTDKDGNITRANANVESISMLVFDFDSGNANPEAIAKPWEGFNCIVHSTWSHSKDKGKYRLIVPLEKPLSAVDFKNIWEDVGKIAGDIDISCKDPSRMFYFPSCPEVNRDIYYFKAFKGKKFYSPKVTKPKKKSKTKRGDYTTLRVVEWFSSHEHYYGQANKPGQHWVKCPWENEHTGETKEEDAFVFEPEGNWPTFSCSHNTCKQNERNITQVMNVWGDADLYCDRILTKDAVKTKTTVKCLGYDDSGHYYYQATNTNNVVRLKPSDHKELNFYAITADLDYWFKYYGNEETGRVDWKDAARNMMGRCHKIGFFKPTSVRGSGCWWDDGRLVVHLGNHLLVNGEQVELTDFRSNFVYEAAVQPIPWKEPLRDTEALTLANLIDDLPIPDNLDRFLFGGHIVASILSGCLRWRPHIWLTGDSGSGKTTILNDVLYAIWGPVGGIFCEGRTTESGVRQRARNNAVPIIIDEVESNSKDDTVRVEGLLATARSASSNSAADVAKGTLSGHGQSFLVKSCFTFSSIVDSLQWSQDKERFLVVSIKASEKSKENWPSLRSKIENTLSTEFSMRLFSRCASLAPVVRKNCDSFAEAIVKTFPKSTTRNADQIGTHAACALALRSSKILTIEEAVLVLNSYGTAKEWAKYWAKDETSFGVSGLDILLSQHLRGETGRNYTVGELLVQIHRPDGPTTSLEARGEEENRILQRYGLLVDKEYFWASKTNSELKNIAVRCGLGSNFAGILRQINHNKAEVKTFMGLKQPAIGIPLEFIFRDR